MQKWQVPDASEKPSQETNEMQTQAIAETPLHMWACVSWAGGEGRIEADGLYFDRGQAQRSFS